jgi:hypothetical protein
MYRLKYGESSGGSDGYSRGEFVHRGLSGPVPGEPAGRRVEATIGFRTHMDGRSPNHVLSYPHSIRSTG